MQLILWRTASIADLLGFMSGSSHCFLAFLFSELHQQGGRCPKGLTPEIREACPTLKGRILISFSRPSLERPSRETVVKVPGDLHVLHLLEALHVLLLLGDVPLVFHVQLRLPDPLLGLVLTDLGRIDIRSGLEYPPPGP
jgi:hypothetical protein